MRTGHTGHTGHLIWTHWTPHYIGDLVWAASNFVLWLEPTDTNVPSCQFCPILAHTVWHTRKPPTLQIAFCHRLSGEECSDGFWAHLTIHHPLCPRPPSISLSPQLIASHAPQGIWRLQKITRACFNSRPSKGTIREQPCDWRQSDSTGKMLTFLRKFSEVCRRVLWVRGI